MSGHPHYFASESHTMCGSPVGGRSEGFATFVEYLTAYQANPFAVCQRCLHCFRRFNHYRGPLKAALQAYCLEFGVDPLDLPRAVLPY